MILNYARKRSKIDTYIMKNGEYKGEVLWVIIIVHTILEGIVMGKQ